MAGGGGTIFSARTQIFSFWTILDHFGPFFVMDDLDSSNSAWEWHQFSLGSARRQTKIQVVCSFLLIFDQFWVLRAKKLRKMTKMFVFQLTLLKKYT